MEARSYAFTLGGVRVNLHEEAAVRHLTLLRMGKISNHEVKAAVIKGAPKELTVFTVSDVEEYDQLLGNLGAEGFKVREQLRTFLNRVHDAIAKTIANPATQDFDRFPFWDRWTVIERRLRDPKKFLELARIKREIERLRDDFRESLEAYVDAKLASSQKK